MGFSLKNLISPAHALRSLVDPIGGTVSAVSGADETKIGSWIDPSGRLIKSDPKTAGNTGPETGAQVDPNQYAGDSSDPAYGSFTKPFDVEQFYNYADPGYAFQLQQGNQALQNSAAAGSGALSGAAIKDLLKYNQDYAGTAYEGAFDRYQTQQNNIFGRLSDIAHLGQAGAAGVGAQGTQLAGNAGQFTSNAGSAAGAGIVGAGNAASSGLMNYWLMQQYNKPMPVSGAQPGSV